MENASQALIIAGGVLIGIIIISMGVYLFTQAVAIPNEYNAKLEKEKLIAFNQKFEAYNRQDVSAQDIITVVNMATENNRQYEETDTEYYIKVYLDGDIINKYTEEEKIAILQSTEIENEQIVYPYTCKEINYSSVTGRVISIKFKKE